MSPSILLFIESWLRKGFEDEELELSATIKAFANAIRGSQTMEVKAAEISSLVDDRTYVGGYRPSIGVATNRIFRSTSASQGLVPGYEANALYDRNR